MSFRAVVQTKITQALQQKKVMSSAELAEAAGVSRPTILKVTAEMNAANCLYSEVDCSRGRAKMHSLEPFEVKTSSGPADREIALKALREATSELTGPFSLSSVQPLMPYNGHKMRNFIREWVDEGILFQSGHSKNRLLSWSPDNFPRPSLLDVHIRNPVMACRWTPADIGQELTLNEG